jgi:siderophore synthetase component
MDATARTDDHVAARADAIVAERLRAAAAIEPLPGEATGNGAVELAANLAAGSPHAARFTEEIRAAVRGTALALEAARPHPGDLWAAAAAAHPDPSVWFEQAVLLGHPTHPLARSRGALTDDEIRAYAPEHGARFALGRYRLPHTVFAPGMRGDADRAGLVPVHPWQARRRGLGEPETAWPDAAPLMSLRTVSIGACHVKTAVDLQLTSAVRRVSPAAAANGPDVVAHLGGIAREHGITLVPETAYLPAGADGEPDAGLAAILRPTPAALGHPRTVPLAALAEPCPVTGRPIAAAIAGERLDPWWVALVDLALAPVRLFEHTGAALEAHGQNTLIAFDGDTPAGLVYRDYGGIRVPRTGWPPLQGDLQTDDADERLRKFTAALFPTTLTAIVAALAAWTGTDPGRWWRPVDRALAGIGGPAAAELRAKPWTRKATTAMRLADNPTDDIWVQVDNPLADA